MLDRAPITPAHIAPFRSPNPDLPPLFHAYVPGSQFTGAGDTVLSALFDLIEMQIETGQPATDVNATIERAAEIGAEALCELIDWICGLDDADPHLAAAIDRLHHIDPERASKRRAWF